MPHVDDGTLHALLDGALQAEERERADAVRAHLATCADCQTRLEQAAALRDQAADVMAGLGADTAPASPDFREVLARADVMVGSNLEGAGGAAGDTPEAERTDTEGPGRTPDRIRRQYRWTRGLAWAATIVIALGAGYLARDVMGPMGRTPERSRGLEGVQPGAATELDTRAPVSEPPAELRTPASADERQRAREARNVGETPAAQPAGEPRSGADVSVREAVEGAGEADDAEGIEGAEDVSAYDGIQEEAGAPSRVFPAAAQQLDADAVLKSGEPLSAEGWVAAALSEAEARVGPVLVLPNAGITRIEVATGGEPLVRTVQMLPGEVEIRVIQAAGQVLDRTPSDLVRPTDDDAPQPAAAEAAAAEQYRGDPQVAAVEVRGGAGIDLAELAANTPETRTVTVTRDGVTLRLAGYLPPEVLLALAAGAAPRED